jgi:hypothetical protein
LRSKHHIAWIEPGQADIRKIAGIMPSRPRTTIARSDVSKMGASHEGRELRSEAHPEGALPTATEIG